MALAISGPPTLTETMAAPIADATFFDVLHRREFAALHARPEIYLDFAGAALPAESQLVAHDRLLRERTYGNPHSEHAPSRAATAAIDAARRRVLACLGADASTHEVVFTANASAAIRLVAEAFPFGPRRGLVLAHDDHNSMNGVAAWARRAGASVFRLPLTAQLALDDPEARLGALAARSALEGALVGFPAQSNFSGLRHPLALVETARRGGARTLLDAAALVSTARLDLAAVRADFVVLSFYKMFGFPTGVGALVARRDALDGLGRPAFAGGTVVQAVGGGERARLRDGAGGFEDGTPNFLGIAALAPGFDLLEAIGDERLARRMRALTRRFLDAVAALRHRDGAPAVRIHGPAAETDRGPIVAWSLLDRHGAIVPCALVEAAAGAAGIALRAGCFCNPGAAETALGVDSRAALSCVERLGDEFTPERFAGCLGAPVGALRVSFGTATRERDVDRAVAFVAEAAARLGEPA